MFKRLRSHLLYFDWPLLISIFFLSAVGLMEIYSVSLGRGGLDLLNVKKQVIFLIFGFILMFFISFLDYYFIRSLSRYLFVAGLLFLVAVLIFGDVSRGTRGWFDFAGFSLQPVEFMKPILIIFLADYFASLATKIKTNKHFFVSLIYTLIPTTLILLQPDFGSALILLAIWLVLIVAADFNLKYFISIALIGIVLFSMAWLFFFKDYQKNRILDFIYPSENVLDSGYNLPQAMIAVGSGGFFGKGLSLGSQSQLKFLPEAQNDFILAALAEELGFLGIIFILFLYALLFFRIFKASRKANDDFAIYFLLGSLGLIFIQMFINIGMNLAIVPIVGLSLPFLSYGGSSLISLMIIIGIMQNIIIKSKTRY